MLHHEAMLFLISHTSYTIPNKKNSLNFLLQYFFLYIRYIFHILTLFNTRYANTVTFTVSNLYYSEGNCQLMGVSPKATNASFALENGREPKKPR